VFAGVPPRAWCSMGCRGLRTLGGSLQGAAEAEGCGCVSPIGDGMDELFSLRKTLVIASCHVAQTGGVHTFQKKTSFFLRL
jgi:hypothetical protein